MEGVGGVVGKRNGDVKGRLVGGGEVFGWSVLYEWKRFVFKVLEICV